MPPTRLTLLFAGVLSAVAATASAQAPPAALENGWTHGTTLGASAGVATDSSTTGAFGGMTMGWELTPTFSIDGSARWLDRGAGSDAFTAAISATVGLTHTRPAVPFVSAGFGLYHFSTGPNATDVPAFYRDRIEQSHATAVRVGHSFTDPAFTLGTGLNLYLTRHMSVRPDVSGVFAFTGSSLHAVPTFGVNVLYHFEDHPVTP